MADGNRNENTNLPHHTNFIAVRNYFNAFTLIWARRLWEMLELCRFADNVNGGGEHLDNLVDAMVNAEITEVTASFAKNRSAWIKNPSHTYTSCLNNF